MKKEIRTTIGVDAVFKPIGMNLMPSGKLSVVGNISTTITPTQTIYFLVDPSGVLDERSVTPKNVQGLKGALKELLAENPRELRMWWATAQSSPSRIAAAWMKKQAGAVNFDSYVEEPDIKRAWQQARDDALFEVENGEGEYDGYSGTILEKNSYEIRRRDTLSRQDAFKFVDQDGESNPKWGPAYAIPVARKTGGKRIGWIFYGYASS